MALLFRSPNECLEHALRSWSYQPGAFTFLGTRETFLKGPNNAWARVHVHSVGLRRTKSGAMREAFRYSFGA